MIFGVEFGVFTAKGFPQYQRPFSYLQLLRPAYDMLDYGTNNRMGEGWLADNWKKETKITNLLSSECINLLRSQMEIKFVGNHTYILAISHKNQQIQPEVNSK